MDADEAVGPPGVGHLPALGDAHRDVALARHEHLGAVGHKQVTQLEGDPEVDFLLLQARGAHRSRLRPAVPGIDAELPAAQGAGDGALFPGGQAESER
jgi:hypothetical protein